MEKPIALETILKCESYGKIAFMQKFRLPVCGNEETFFLFDSKKKSVIIFAITEKNEVIAVKQFRYGANDFVIEIPGGNIESDIIKKGNFTEEIVIKTAKEELHQETGYTSKNVIRIGPEIWIDPASSRASLIPVLAERCWQASEPQPEKTEILETLLIPFRKWMEMINRKEICDSKTVAITMMVLCHFYFNHVMNVIL